MDGKMIEAFSMLLTGLGGVFGVLAFFYLLMLLINNVYSKLNKRKADKKLTPIPELANTEKIEEISPEILAVIAGAVYATLQEKVKIKTIKFLTQPDDTSWSRIGRLSLMESHIVKK